MYPPKLESGTSEQTARSANARKRGYNDEILALRAFAGASRLKASRRHARFDAGPVLRSTTSHSPTCTDMDTFPAPTLTTSQQLSILPTSMPPELLTRLVRRTETLGHGLVPIAESPLAQHAAPAIPFTLEKRKQYREGDEETTESRKRLRPSTSSRRASLSFPDSNHRRSSTLTRTRLPSSLRAMQMSSRRR